jgi:tryptophanyl-tRNA synthetase
VDCKKKMAGNLIKALIPIKEKREELELDAERVESIIEQGNRRAGKIARATMEEVRTAVKI